jgi:hypothetical protein
MSPAQTELFDLAVLQVLAANRTRYGLTQRAVSHLLAEFGFPSPDGEVLADRVDYLTRKGLAEEVQKTVNLANRTWRITEAGLNHVDTHG